ncbi:MAG TPA: peptidoglycan-binding domain-containing protein [Pyrinomonadaceae bacterium]|nr:peptidoglycan-binding domain-containing protein [Pyrinomonadaceae bacterium]
MKKVLTLTLSLLLLCSAEAFARNTQTASSSKSNAGANSNRKRGPVFRATKDQINQAQAILKERGFYAGEQTGKLDDATRDGLRKYQQAEGLKSTGTLNKVTLEKMGVPLTDRQKAM